MRRALIAAVLVVLITGSSRALAADQVPEPADGSHASADFDLRASNGLHAEFENFNDRIVLTIHDSHYFVIYSVIGAMTERSVEAQFGALGRISFQFEPAKTLDSTRPPPECTGKPWTEKEGFFTGLAEFHGERGYTSIDVHRVRGTMRTAPEWRCSKASGPIHLPPLADVAARPHGDVATLTASSRDGRGFLAASQRDAHGRGATVFSASLRESREGMEIGRGVGAVAIQPARFEFDRAAGTATVRPPTPFRGSASFKRRPGGRAVWTGSLSVPLLGADPIELAGAGFVARLVHDFPGD